MELPRIGFGYDVHPLVAGQKLMLGGVEIPHEKGLSGHSDADVLIHALCDALLGALALGDIGSHFPAEDIRYKGREGSYFLEAVKTLVTEAGYRIGNVDVTVVLQRPKIQPYVLAMRETVAFILEIPVEKVSVKATTTEHLGMTGREEAAAAYAVALLQKV